MTTATIAASEPAAPPPDDSVATMPRRWVRWSVLAAIVVVALLIRWRFLGFETMDYRAFVSRW